MSAMRFHRTLVVLSLAICALVAAHAGPSAAQAPIEPLYIPAMVVSEANFRADPSTGKPPLDTFQAGKQVLITGATQDDRGRDWYAVRIYDDGREGFIFGTLLRPLPEFPNPPSGFGVTEVGDATEKGRLVGRHGITLQWIGVDPQGEVVAFDNLGAIFLTGGQVGTGAAASDQLWVSGWVWRVDANSFLLSGTIRYKVASLTGNGECSRQGDFVFSRPAGREYWRLEQVTSPCGKWDQYLDIYLRKE